MKKFKFQLETLLKVTKRKKDEAEIAFAAASRALEEERATLTRLLSEMQQGQRDYEELTQEGKRVTIARIMTFNSFFGWKREQIEEQQQRILQAQAVRQKQLKVLMELISYLKSIEQLKEKRYREYQQELLFEEQKMLDEIGLQLFMRNRKASEAS